MNKKTQTRLCWNCEGEVAFSLNQCPFCGVEVESAPIVEKVLDEPSLIAVTEEEWKTALEKEEGKEKFSRDESISLLLLLPGVVFFLFGLGIYFFSEEEGLKLTWKKEFAYFYLLGALPLLFFGWKRLTK